MFEPLEIKSNQATLGEAVLAFLIVIVTFPTLVFLIGAAYGSLDTPHYSPVDPFRSFSNDDKIKSAVEVCRSSPKPQDFKFVARETVSVGAESATVVEHYRTSRPPADIFAFFRAVLTQERNYDKKNDLFKDSITSVAVTLLPDRDSGGEDVYAITCSRFAGEEISFSIYDT